MQRLALCALAPLLLSTLACASHGGVSSPTIAPPGLVNLDVDSGARVDRKYYKLQIAPGANEVVWKASADKVQKLWIVFKPDTGAEPPDPVCQGATCTFPAASSVDKEGVYHYVVGVKLKKNGAWKVRDPMLIIKR